MQGEPAEPPSPQDGHREDRPEDPNAVAARLRHEVAHARRWFEWERWMLEPRSFAAPEESGIDDHDSES